MPAKCDKKPVVSGQYQQHDVPKSHVIHYGEGLVVQGNNLSYVPGDSECHWLPTSVPQGHILPSHVLHHDGLSVPCFLLSLLPRSVGIF